jgi:LPXTG-motif cell wall-anchored protein
VVAGAASLTIPAGPTATTRIFQARYNGSPDIAPSDSTNFDLVVTTVVAPPTTLAPSTPVTITSTTPVPIITNDTVLAQTGPSHEIGTWTTAGILLVAGVVLMWIGRRRYDRQH